VKFKGHIYARHDVMKGNKIQNHIVSVSYRVRGYFENAQKLWGISTVLSSIDLYLNVPDRPV
jgi:hypothetical protein